ncbi:hypothetical protein Hanom_Chr05g00436551 [Helianthus anomalus]
MRILKPGYVQSPRSYTATGISTFLLYETSVCGTRTPDAAFLISKASFGMPAFKRRDANEFTVTKSGTQPSISILSKRLIASTIRPFIQCPIIKIVNVILSSLHLFSSISLTIVLASSTLPALQNPSITGL